MVQDGAINQYDVNGLLSLFPQHQVEVEFSNRVWENPDECSIQDVFDLVDLLKESPPEPGRLTLDGLCPDSGRILYLPESGLSLEERYCTLLAIITKSIDVIYPIFVPRL
jgi:hypothetical protein